MGADKENSWRPSMVVRKRSGVREFLESRVRVDLQRRKQRGRVQ